MEVRIITVHMDDDSVSGMNVIVILDSVVLIMVNLIGIVVNGNVVETSAILRLVMTSEKDVLSNVRLVTIIVMKRSEIFVMVFVSVAKDNISLNVVSAILVVDNVNVNNFCGFIVSLNVLISMGFVYVINDESDIVLINGQD